MFSDHVIILVSREKCYSPNNPLCIFLAVLVSRFLDWRIRSFHVSWGVSCEHRGVDGRTERAVSRSTLNHVEQRPSRHLTFIISHQRPMQGGLSELGIVLNCGNEPQIHSRKDQLGTRKQIICWREGPSPFVLAQQNQFEDCMSLASCLSSICWSDF